MTITALLSANVSQKTVGCENIQKLKKAQQLEGTKHFIKFLVMEKCQVLQKDSKVTILGENHNLLKILSFNQRTLWVNKKAINQ